MRAAVPASHDRRIRDDAAVVLQRALDTFPHQRIAVVSAFGPGSIVLLHLLERAGVSLPVIFIDTLYHFPETLELAERVRRRFALDLRVFRAAASREEFERLHGPALWETDLERYHELTKVAPFRAAMCGFDACISGRRRDQSAARAALAAREEGTPTRINPLAHWRRSDVWAYIHAYALPYNPLHDRGYGSIGDAPLTTPVQDGEPERAGRWRGSDRQECGIHTASPEPAP
jgi:phosphoadenosine phosphosulfate reductase